MEGYLLKKGRHASLHTWHRRFFVLRQAAPQVFILEQYLTEFEHGAPKHAMNVAGASVSETPETSRGVRLTTVDGDTLELRADTPEEMEEWRRAFRAAAAAAAAAAEIFACKRSFIFHQVHFSRTLIHMHSNEIRIYVVSTMIRLYQSLSQRRLTAQTLLHPF